MNKQEAIQAMKEGKKVSHRYMASSEYITSNKIGNVYYFEDGISCDRNTFWQDRRVEQWDEDWEIVGENNIPFFSDDEMDDYHKSCENEDMIDKQLNDRFSDLVDEEDIDDEAGEREYLRHLYNSGQASDDEKLMLGIIED